MSNYAEAKITDDERLMYQNDICHYYATVCKRILDKNGKAFNDKDGRPSELNHQLMESLLKHETNIWAAVSRMVDIPQEELKKSFSDKANITQRLSTKHDQPVPQPIDREEVQEEMSKLRRFSTLMQDQFSSFRRQATLTGEKGEIEIKDLGGGEKHKKQNTNVSHKSPKKSSLF